MAIVLEFTNQGTHFNRDVIHFLCFGNVGPPYMAMLYPHRFTIGLLVWFFSTSLVPNTQNSPPQPSFPSQQHQPHVDPFFLHPLCLIVFLLLHLVKVLMPVTRWLRRRRIKIRNG